MANPTTNFGWQMPTATDLVTDLPADFEVFGQAVDTDFVGLKGGTTGQVLAKASGTDLDFVWSADAAGMTNPMTTTGDIIYSSSGSTPARLGIGSAADVLTVAGGVPTWAAPAGAAASFSLLNSGGTALSGSATVTISGLSGYSSFYLMVDGATMGASGSYLRSLINGSSVSEYDYFGARSLVASTYSANLMGNRSAVGTDYIPIATWSGSATSAIDGGISFIGCNSSGKKMFDVVGGVSAGGSQGQEPYWFKGVWNNTSTVTSLSVETASGGNFTGGTIYLYGSAV